MGKSRYVIVIGREYGSGGRRIGEMISRCLGVSYYDKRLLREAACQMGYSSEIFIEKDERRPSLLRTILSCNYGASATGYEQGPMSAERLYELQSEVIKEISERESCVIVGRTADYILRDHPGMLSIFIHAPKGYRSAEVMKRGEAGSIEKAKEIIERKDRERASYYNYYTNDRGWGEAKNYHLTFDSTRISDEGILRIVKEMIDRKG